MYANLLITIKECGVAYKYRKAKEGDHKIVQVITPMLLLFIFKVIP